MSLVEDILKLNAEKEGITGQITGGRATLIVADDIEIPANSRTEEARTRLLHYSTEFEAIRTYHPPTGGFYPERVPGKQPGQSLWEDLRDWGGIAGQAVVFLGLLALAFCGG